MKKRSEPKSIVIDGYLLPWRQEQPVSIIVEGVWFIAIFSTMKKLEQSMEFAGVKEYSIKQIDDGIDFIDSIKEQGGRIMLDPYIVNGNTRFTEITLR